jgi:hypothetical protein
MAFRLAIGAAGHGRTRGRPTAPGKDGMPQVKRDDMPSTAARLAMLHIWRINATPVAHVSLRVTHGSTCISLRRLKEFDTYPSLTIARTSRQQARSKAHRGHQYVIGPQDRLRQDFGMLGASATSKFVEKRQPVDFA